MKRLLLCLVLSLLYHVSEVVACDDELIIHHHFGHSRCLNRIQVKRQDEVVGSIFYYDDVKSNLIYCERLSIYDDQQMTAIIHSMIERLIQQHPTAQRLFVKSIVACFRWTTERDAMPSYRMVRLILGQLKQLMDVSPRRPNRLFSISPPV